MTDLQRGKMVNSKVNIFSTEIYGCIKTGNICMCHDLIRKGESVHATCEDSGNTYLHIVMQEVKAMNEDKYVPFVYLLSNAGIDLDARNLDGYTAFHLSVKRNLLQMMTAVLKCGAMANTEDENLISKFAGYFVADYISSFRKFSPGLWESVTDNNRFRVNKLVKSWCRVNISHGNTSLIEHAKEIGVDSSIVGLLTKHEASIEFAHATIAGDEDRMKVLLCNGSVDLSVKDLSYRENFFQPFTPLGLEDVVLKYGHKHVQYLVTGKRRPEASASLSDNESSVVCSII